jgi:hypothetical protein
MPARKNTAHSELVRARIKSSQLVNRLQGFVLGAKDRKSKRKIDMSPHQVAAALGLLRKTVPDIQSIEHLGEVAIRHHIVSADPLTEEQWQEQYGEQRLNS